MIWHKGRTKIKENWGGWEMNVSKMWAKRRSGRTLQNREKIEEWTWGGRKEEREPTSSFSRRLFCAALVFASPLTPPQSVAFSSGVRFYPLSAEHPRPRAPSGASQTPSPQTGARVEAEDARSTLFTSRTMESADNGSDYRSQLSSLYNNTGSFCQNFTDANNTAGFVETRCDPDRRLTGNLDEDANPVIIAIIITALYSIVCVVGLVGNVLVMYIIVR